MSVKAHENGDDKGSDRLVLVYQMQKVASMTWMTLARHHFAAADAMHVHYLAEDHLAYLRAQFEATGPQQTVKQRIVLRHLLQTGGKVRGAIEEAGSHERPLLVVTGMRDPIARSVSLLFFLADFYGHTEARLSWRDAAQFADVQRMFISTWERAFDREEPADTFARILSFYFKAYGFWFERELGAVLGINVLGGLFPPGPARRLIVRDRTQALVYRMEDIAPDSRGNALLRADVAAIAGAPVTDFPVVNAGAFRNSRDLYRAFLQQLRVPARLLDRVYDAPVVRCFYTAEEVDGFRRRWLNGPD